MALIEVLACNAPALFPDEFLGKQEASKGRAEPVSIAGSQVSLEECRAAFANFI